MSSKSGNTESISVSSAHSSPSKQKSSVFGGNRPTGASTSGKVSGFALAQSPSLPEMTALQAGGHLRTSSDVQGLVKRFEHLELRDRDAENAERRRRHEAELRRAQIAREEAESDVKRLREEVRRLRKDNDEGRERERKVAKRLEVVLEEHAHLKETQSSQAAVYERELRKARKEAFRSSSHLLTLQEELKSARQSLRISRSGLDVEKQKVQRREQETFEAQYESAAVQEELGRLRQALRVAEEQKEALKMSLREDDIARAAADGLIALPDVSGDNDDRAISPRKCSPVKPGIASPVSDDKENMPAVARKRLEYRKLQNDLCFERTRREHVEEMVLFLSLECAFKCCACRHASEPGQSHALLISGELADSLEAVRRGIDGVAQLPGDLSDADGMRVDVRPGVTTGSVEMEEAARIEHQAYASRQALRSGEGLDGNDSVTILAHDVPEAGTTSDAFEADQGLTEDSIMLPSTASLEPQYVPESLEQHPESNATLQASDSSTPLDQHQPSPFRTRPSVHTVTMTTTVPTHFHTPSKPRLINVIEDAENVPPPPVFDSSIAAPTFDRAAALAAIEYRRGRARSIAMGHYTPVKQMVDGVSMKERRDISAPVMGCKSPKVNYAPGMSTVGRQR